MARRGGGWCAHARVCEGGEHPILPQGPPQPIPSTPFPTDGPWETAESCVVRTSASVYRRLQESPWQPPVGMSVQGTPPPLPPRSSSSPLASGQLLKFESEDSGVEMASNEHSPSTPTGSKGTFSLDGFPPKSPCGEEPGNEPPRPPRSRSASKKLVQAAQRSRRQRAPGRCPRQLGRHSGSVAELRAERGRDPEEPSVEDPDGAEGVAVARGAWPPGSPRAPTGPRAGPEVVEPMPGQGLRYLEHVCQMLECLARLQQDNRLLRQRAADARHTSPDAMVRAGRRQGVGVGSHGGGGGAQFTAGEMQGV